MRNNVNSNGLINGGYTANNQNVIQIPFYNPEIQSVQLATSPFISSQSYMGSPQQMPFQSIYNQIPNYYSMGVMNYSPQTSAVPYGQLLMQQNGYPNQMNVIDPNTGAPINLPQQSTPIAPKRRSTLQIIDPTTKSEIDVTKIGSSLREESSKNNNSDKDFKFNFEIEKLHEEVKVPEQSPNEVPIKECEEEKSSEVKMSLEIQNNTPIKEEVKISEEHLEVKVPEVIEEDKVSEIKLEKEVNIKTEEVSKELVEEQRAEISQDSSINKDSSINREELELQNIIQEINQDDEDDFTEVVSKKKKNKQSKLIVNEVKVADKQKTSVNNKNNNFRKDNRENNANKKDNTEGKGKRISEPNNGTRRMESGQKESPDSISPKKSPASNDKANNGYVKKDVPRNDNLNTNSQRHLQNNDRFNRNGNNKNNFNETNNNQKSDNGLPHRNDSRNPSVHRNGSRNPSIHRNDNQNAMGQQFENRNQSIHRNGSRNPSIQRNESQNPRVQRFENRNENRNQNIQRNESRNSSIQRNEVGNVDNDSRNRNGPIGGGSRNSSMHRQQSRFNNGNYKGNFDDNRNESYQRNDYRGRNMNRNESQSGYRNGSFSRNENRNGNNFRNNDHRTNSEHCTATPNLSAQNDCPTKNNIEIDNKQVNQNQEKDNQLPSNIVLKTPLNFSKAFRKGSSPFYVERRTELEKPSNLELSTKNEIAEKPVVEEINALSDKLNQLTVELDKLAIEDTDRELRNDHVEIQKDTTDIAVSNESSNVDNVESAPVEQESEIKVETSPELVDVPKPDELEQGSIETESVDTNADGKVQEETEIVSEKSDNTEEVNLNVEEEDNETESDRLTYYREHLLSLRGSQSLPEHFFSDPSLMDVVSIKIQLINFLKKRESFTKPNNVKSDNLDFTRRHHIRPKRLVRGDNGYLPPQLRQKTEDEIIVLKRNIKSILNKMTPENFDICTNDIVHLEIEKEENMRCLIDEIFSKAIQEESYSTTYAKFCQHMCTARVGKESFKSLLLRSCQNMFEKPLHTQLEEVRQLWENKAADEKDEKMKKLYESDIEEQVKKAKDKYFGNIRFFSELFLTKQLSGRIIIMCVEKLLYFEKDSNSLEAACKLVQICGKELERVEKERASEDKKFSKIMNQFVSLANKSDLEARLRFKIKDIVDMRERNWELRGIQKAIINTPKTLDEIKEDRNKEETEKAKITYQHNNNNNNNNNSKFRQPFSRPAMDTKKLQLNTQNMTKDTILGPEIRTQWGTGCKSNNNGWNAVQSNRRQHVAQEEVDKPQMVKVQNKYAQLEVESDAEVPANTTAVTTTPTVKAIDDEKVIDEIFDQIMKNMCPVTRWKEIFNPISVIEKWFDVMFNRKKECRVLLGDYFHDLIANGLLTFEQLLEGAASTMECIDDLINDVPLFWSWLPEFLERFIKFENSNVSFIMDLLKDVDHVKNVEKCLRLVKELSSERIGADVVENLFGKSQQ